MSKMKMVKALPRWKRQPGGRGVEPSPNRGGGGEVGEERSTSSPPQLFFPPPAAPTPLLLSFVL